MNTEPNDKPDPPYPGHRIRPVRVSDELWDAAAEAAAAEGTNVSAIIRECLARYVRRANRRARKGHSDASPSHLHKGHGDGPSGH